MKIKDKRLGGNGEAQIITLKRPISFLCSFNEALTRQGSASHRRLHVLQKESLHVLRQGSASHRRVHNSLQKKAIWEAIWSFCHK